MSKPRPDLGWRAGTLPDHEQEDQPCNLFIQGILHGQLAPAVLKYSQRYGIVMLIPIVSHITRWHVFNTLSFTDSQGGFAARDPQTCLAQGFLCEVIEIQEKIEYLPLS
jgi:hypothetical protein